MKRCEICNSEHTQIGSVCENCDLHLDNFARSRKE